MTAMRHSGNKFFSNLAIAAFAGAAFVISLSGAMPGLWRAALALAARIGTSIEYRLSIDPFDRTDLGLASDELGHLILWGFGMLSIGLITRNRFPASFVAVSLFAASLALEVGQSLLTTNRSMSLGDAHANAVGIMVGLSAVVVIEVAIRAFSPKSNSKLSTD